MRVCEVRILKLAALSTLLALALPLLAGCGTDSTTTVALDVTTTVAADASTTVAADATTAAQSTAGQTDASVQSTQVVGGKDASDYEAAIPELEKALEGNPEDLAVLQDLAVAQYNLKQYEAAAQTYEKMLGIEDKAFVRNNYANVLRDWGKADLAQAEYTKAIEAEPTLAVAYINLANLLVRQDLTADAVVLLDQGIAAVGEADKERLESYKAQLTGAGQ